MKRVNIPCAYEKKKKEGKFSNRRMIGELEREGRMKKKRERRGRVNLTLERVRFQTVTLNP